MERFFFIKYASLFAARATSGFRDPRPRKLCNDFNCTNNNISTTKIIIIMTPTITFKASNIKPEVVRLLKTSRSPDGTYIDVTSKYITINGKPVIPVSGEFQFSRYPHQLWEEELLKMKACGINIIATYIFWIHHEEIQDEFDWTGDRDLRAFIQLCGKHSLHAFVRMGPFCHGECRNGGIPDWMWDRQRTIVRTTDPAFLDRVHILYGEIATQISGLLFKDGGPVIMVQLDNEYCQGEDGIPYMQALKQIANDVGIDVPIYTMTGWGNASIPPNGELLPMFGSYPEAPWSTDPRPYGTDHSRCWFFTPERDDDFIDNNGIIKDWDREKYRYPYLTCETGPGVQVTYTRRPIINPADVASLALIKIANGANMLGYYVFHGGTHPMGKLTPMHETFGGRPSMLEYPTFSYDFQAPLGEFGQVKPSYHEFKLLHVFLRNFGMMLAPMEPILPDQLPVDLDDTVIPRIGMRTADGSGFLFFNNHDRYNANLHDIEDVHIQITQNDETLVVPRSSLAMKRGAFFILPVNIRLGNILLKYSTTQPLAILEDNDSMACFFFQVDGIEPEYAFDASTISDIDAPSGNVENEGNVVFVTGITAGTGNPITVKDADGCNLTIITISRAQALHAWNAMVLGKIRLFIASANLTFDGDAISCYGTDINDFAISVYPAPEHGLQVGDTLLNPAPDGIFTRFAGHLQGEGNQDPMDVAMEEVAAGSWLLSIPQDALQDCDDLFLSIEYIGNSAKLYIDDVPVADDFYSGIPWNVGIKRWAPGILGKKIRLEIEPLEAGDDIYMEKWPTFEPGTREICQLLTITAMRGFKATITIL